jgi:thiol-disulfide isomerase/thioredoxin
MKKHCFLFLVFLLAAGALPAQTAKKYLLIEHFTNSWCSICKSRNPGFYNTIAPYAKDIHHISIHPSTPYAQCIFYQANKTENQARADYYSVIGTPRVALNGIMQPNTTTLLPLTALQTALAQKTAPLAVKMTDVIGGGNFKTTVQINYDQALPSGDYVLHVMLVEKHIQLTTPNGETDHYDVFRDQLTPAGGVSLAVGSAGMTIENTYSAPLNAAWNTTELYAIGFVQNKTTKEVLNSGSRFDVTSAAQEVSAQSLTLQPNPAHQQAVFQLEEGNTPTDMEVYGIDGRRYNPAFSVQGGTGHINTTELPEGVYIVKVQSARRIHTGKFVVRH